MVLPAGRRRRREALRTAHEAGRARGSPSGSGSNILLPDEGLDALVIRLGKGLDGLEHGRRVLDGRRRDCRRPLAARKTAAAGFAGLHIFVGVPGSVGGGVYMNAGCHGGDWSEVVER